MNLLFTVIGGKFKFQVQDSDLEYIFLEIWIFEKHIALSEKKSLLMSSFRSQLPGRLFSPSDKSKKLSHHFLLHFSIGMGSYDHHAKYQGVLPDLL